MGMVNAPAGCAGCHKLGVGYSMCSGCALHFCSECAATLGGACSNCGSRLV